MARFFDLNKIFQYYEKEMEDILKHNIMFFYEYENLIQNGAPKLTK